MRMSGRIPFIAVIVLCIALITTVFVPVAGAVDLGKHDLNGETVTIVWWGNYFPETDLEMLERKELAEKEFNCKIQMLTVGWGEYSTTLMNRLLSGDSKYDLWSLYSDFFWNLVGQDAFFPVNNVLPSDYFQRWGASSPSAQLNGQIYGFSSPLPAPTEAHVLFFNKTIFEREGIDSPYDYVASGTWTWDVFTQMARAATKDFNGDGQMDQWGFVNAAEVTPMIGFTNSAYPAKVDENGKLVFAYDSPEAIETLTQIYKWCSVDKVAQGWSEQLFAQGKAAMVFAPAFYAGDYMNNLQDDFGIVPFPMGPSATKYVYPTRGSSTWALPRNSANPLALIALWDFLFEKRYTEDEKQAATEETLMSWSKDRESFETLLGIEQSWREHGFKESYEYRVLFNTAGFHSAGYYPTSWGEKTPATAMQELKPVVQALLDETLHQ